MPAGGFNPMSPGVDQQDDFSLWQGVLVMMQGERYGAVRHATLDGRCTVQPGTLDEGTGFVSSGALLGRETIWE